MEMFATTKQQICVNLEKSLIERIDRIAGDVPRSRVVERALNAQLGDHSASEMAGNGS